MVLRFIVNNKWERNGVYFETSQLSDDEILEGLDMIEADAKRSLSRYLQNPNRLYPCTYKKLIQVAESRKLITIEKEV